MISAVVVTFNKVNLLKECVNAILKQTVLPDNIIIIDNNSSDGTPEYLKELALNNKSIIPIFLDKNIGGAGGFNMGIKKAMYLKSEYIWVMDDDTIPESKALEELINAKDNIGVDNFSFLASNVRWIDGTPCLMNIPHVFKNWNSLLNYVELEFSSFVSMFINAKSVKQIGYPIADFFIWGDDVEYAKRLGMTAPGYYVDHSIVVHKMAQNDRTNILTDSENRLPRYYYASRNGFYVARKQGFKEVVRHIMFNYFWLSAKIIFSKNDHKLKKLGIINRGFFKGMFYNPEVETYIDE